MTKIKAKFYNFLLIIFFPYFGGDHGSPRFPPPSVIGLNQLNLPLSNSNSNLKVVNIT